MKKIIGFLALVVALTALACNDKPVETKKEVIIVKDPPAKSTTVTVDKNGVKVEAKKVDVTVKK